MIKSKILLHACCAPCLTAAHDRLKSEYDIDIVWYNPNIYPVDEEKKRLAELRRYAGEVKANLIELPCNDDDIVEWKQSVVSFAHLPEGQRRCSECIYFRLNKMTKFAKKEKYKRVATTLTVSPKKSAILVNNALKKSSINAGLEYIEADFKKQNGYLKSIELSKAHNLYRQNYCGCEYSLSESKQKHEI
jgi:predicted adenine nucleotide alpha hydrolase (AANH) superfamily ATPase